LAEKFSPHALELFGRVILFRAASLAVALSAAAAVISMAEHAVERLAFDMSVAVRPAPEAWMWSAAQVLPKIFGHVVHLFHRHRPKSGEPFAMEMSIFALYRPGACGPWSRLWSGFEKKSPARRTTGKADYRDAALPFLTF
jgi:hypothetical protein